MKGRGGSAMKGVDENVAPKATVPEKGEEPSKFRKYTSLSAMKAGDGSFRGLFSLSKPADKSGIYNGPSMREVGPQYYLREEIRAAREAVTKLDKAVSAAQSFREKSTSLLEEAHRALGRLEQAVAYRDGAPELIVIACEIKCAARRGITLVDVYGKYSTMVKVMTLFMRSYIHSKFDKQIDHLKSLIPPAEVMRGAPVAATQMQQEQQQQQQQQPSNRGIPSVLSGPTSGPLSSIPSSAGAPSLPSTATVPSMTPASQGPGQPAPGIGQAQGPSLARSSTSHQTQQPPSGKDQAPPLVGTMLRPNKHDRVHAMAYVPPGQASSEYVCIWWSAGMMLEFYSEATQSTTGFQIEKPSLNVTALGIDEDGNVWTGHAKGMVRVRPKQQWEFMVEDKAFSSAVKAITFDDFGRAWVGDDSGRIKVLGYDPRAGRLETVVSLQRSPALLAKMKGALADTTRGLFGKRHCPSSGSGGQASAATVFAAASAAAAAAAAEAQNLAAAITSAAGREFGPGSSAGGHNPPVAIEGPVRCIFLRGGRAWTSGGKSSGWLQLWDANSFQDLDVYDCCGFGPCHAMASVRWPTPASSAAPSVLQHRRTPSDSSRQPGGGGVFDTAAVAAAAAAGTPAQSSAWRLLTGHENGQLLLWHPDHKGLSPLLRIGEPGSPCRGIASFDGFRLVATGHQNGELHVFVQPSAESGLPPGSESATPQSFGTLRPRMVTIQAHKSRVDRMAYSGTSCVTASMLGTIRMWHAADLAVEAHRQGLLAHTPSYGSLLAATNGSALSAVPSLQTLGNRYSASTSMGDLVTAPSPMYPLPHYHRDSAKRNGPPSDAPGPGSAGMIVGSPLTAGQQYGGPNLAGASTMSTNLSVVLSQGSQGSAVPAPGQPVAPGSASHHHTRQGSKDSSETVGGSLTQPSSTGTLLAEGTGGSVVSQQGLPAQAAVFQHFQTIEASELSMKKLIGSGAYGKVWLTDWTGCQVAVKELFGLQGGISSSEKEYSALMNEVTLLGSLSHPNIMRFLAMCLDPPLIVMQYYPHGSLFDLLHRAQKGSAKAAKELTWTKRLDMLRDVAAGMQYLHSRKPPVIHGDLRSPNLLLDLTIDHDRPRFHVKIADFGLARMANNATGSVMVSKTTNPRWLAPEVIRNSSVGKAADVYSFGIIMWEMLTWQQPYEDMMSVQVMFSTVTENSRPEVPPESQLPGSPGVSLQMYRQLMENCWHAEATQRPSFKDVVECFQGMQRVETEFAKQQRQQQPQAGTATPAQAGHRSRVPSETGHTPGPAPGSGGTATATADGPSAPPAPGSGGSGGAGPAAAATGAQGAAAIAAAARRGAGAAGASPFQNTPSPFSGTAPSPFAGNTAAAGPYDADRSPAWGTPGGSDPAQHTAATNQQMGSVLPFYGMSPILEEQFSSATNAATGDGGPGSARRSVTMNAAPVPGGPSPGASRLGESPGIPSPFSARQPSPQTATNPFAAASQAYRQVSLPQHPHHQPHVHFAPSAFAVVAGDGDGLGSGPPSPRNSARNRSSEDAARSNHAPSSASSLESGLPTYGVSVGSNHGGGPSTASSSRQSSTSTSGRNIGAAVAAAATAAAAAAAHAGPNTGGLAAGRKSGGPPGRQGGGSGTSTPRRDGVAGAGGSGATGKAPSRIAGMNTSVGASPTGEALAAPLWEAGSIPAGSMTILSPFASLPAAQLGDLDLAAAGHDPAMPQYVQHPAHTHLADGGRHAGSSAAGAGAHRVAGTAVAVNRTVRPSSICGSVQGPNTGAASRARIPGPSFGPGLTTSRAGHPTGSTTTGHGVAARATGATTHSQPSTPAYRGAPASPHYTRGAGGPTSAVGARSGSITGPSPGASATNSAIHGPVQRSQSGDGPSNASSRTASITVASVDASQATLGASDPHHGQQRTATRRKSYSAAHAHVDGADEGVPSGAAGGGGGPSSSIPVVPGHRRTPSGGSIPTNTFTASTHVVRTRELVGAPAATAAGSATGPAAHHHREVAGSGSGPLPRLRTPTAASRSGRASPRVSTPSSGGDTGRPSTGSRRNTPATAAAATTTAHGTASPSPGTGYLSRLGASIGGGSRPPASPRAYIPGGPGSVSAHASSGTPSVPVGGGAPGSRIPSLSLRNNQGSVAPAPAKSSTSRSLDDLNLHRISLSEATSGASPVASPSAAAPTATGPGPAAGRGTACIPFAVSAGAWEDGLAMQHSPEPTSELPRENAFLQSAGYPRMHHEGADGEEARSSATGGTGGAVDGAVVEAPGLRRIATESRRTEESPPRTSAAAAAAPAWEPPSLRPAMAPVGGSPFAAAAYRSPFQIDNQADDAEEREEPTFGERPTSGAVAAAAAAAFAGRRPGPDPPSAGGAPDRPAGWIASPFSAGSPFAQHAGDDDPWWEDQRHHDN